MNFTNKVIFFWILLNFPNLIDTKKHGKHGKHSTITSTNTLITSTNNNNTLTTTITTTLTTTNNNILTTTSTNTLTTTSTNTLTTTNNNILTTTNNNILTTTITTTLTTTNNNILTTTLINIERIGKSDSSKSDSIKKNQIDNRKKQKLSPAWHIVYIVIILGLVSSIYYYTKKPKEIIINDVPIEYDMASNIRTYEQPVTENPLYRQLDLGNYEEIDPEYQVV